MFVGRFAPLRSYAPGNVPAALGATAFRAKVAVVAIMLALFAIHPAVSVGDSAPSTDAAGMARRVDELIAARWTQLGVEPAELADDGEILRRLYLDLAGTIPTVWEAREFLADSSPDKRARLIDRLLESPACATHLADVWRDLLLPRKFDSAQAAGQIGVQNWLRRQFVENRRYDRLVADLLVATGGDESGPALFYTAVGLKPEELAASTSRIFLGVRLDCAQCHNHPFAKWTQQDFWGYAAFFARLQQRAGNPANVRLVDADSGEVHLPDSDTIVPARYLGGPPVDASELGTRRQQLAIWMVGRDNPYLAPATANLVWAQLFGRGLVEPVDDFGDHNPASHPQLLSELADFITASDYNLRELYRVLTSTRAYQLTSRSANSSPPPAESFAAMAVKTLSPEQLYDSLNRVALGRGAAMQDRLADPERQAFLVRMQTQTRTATDFELSVPQALALLNGPEMASVSDAAQSRLLAALEAPMLSDRQRVEIAFLATLSRLFRGDEADKFVGFVRSKPAEARKAALGDLVWALLNSAEFTLNH